MRQVTDLLQGKVTYTFEGPFPERLLNICAARRIPFGGVRWLEPTRLQLTVLRREGERLRRAAAEIPGTLFLERRKGLPFLLGRLRRRHALILAGGGCALLLFAASFFVWDFRLEGNDTVAEEKILRALEEEGIGLGCFGLSINSTQLRNRVLLRLPELSYIAVNVRGCVAYVQVRERIPAPEIYSKRSPANVVAAKDGLITRVEAWDGYAAVLPGTTVRKGQLLISGVADSEQSGVRLLHGMGKVYARTWYDLTALVPLQLQQKQYTGEKKSFLSVLIGRKRIKFYGNSSIAPTDCDKITTEKGMDFLGVALPIRIEWQRCRRYILKASEVPETAARAQGEKELLQQLKDRLSPGGKIISTRFASRRRGDMLLVTLTAECTEQIGESVSLTDEAEK